MNILISAGYSRDYSHCKCIAHEEVEGFCHNWNNAKVKWCWLGNDEAIRDCPGALPDHGHYWTSHMSICEGNIL